MFEEIPIITTSQYVIESTKWLEALRRGENVCVSFFPKTDRFIRIGQLLKDTELLSKVLGPGKQYMFQRLYFDPHDAEDMDDLDHQLAEHLSFAKILAKNDSVTGWMSKLRDSNTQIIFVIADAEKFLKPESKQVLELLTRTIEMYDPHVQFLLLFERDVTHPDCMEYLPASTRIYENVFQYPLYDEHETIQFIKMLGKQWDIPLDDATAQSVYTGCGGHFWLVKEAMRELAGKKKWSPQDSGMTFRVRMTYDLMVKSERSLLKKKIGNVSELDSDEKHSMRYLRRMRFFHPSSEDIPKIYTEYVLNRQDISDKLNIQNNRIVLQNMPIDAFFSRKEYRVMRAFLQNRGTIVTRDIIARAMWPDNTEDEYSDWAIDQMIARIRKKMAQLSLNPKLLKTLRGKGYMLAIT